MKPYQTRILIAQALILSLSVSEVTKAENNLEKSQDIQTIDQVSDVLHIQDSQALAYPQLDKSMLGLIPRTSEISPCDGGYCFNSPESVSPGERVLIYEQTNCIWAATGKVGVNGKIVLDRQNTNLPPKRGDLALIMGQDAEIVVPIACSYRT